MANTTIRGRGFQVRWFDTGFLRAIDSETDRNLKRAGLFLVKEIKKSINSPGRSGAKRSRPGNPPLRQSGSLYKSITRQRKNNEERVGTNLDHGLYLEFGTRKMAARPFLRPAIIKNKKKIAKIILKGSTK